MKGIDGDDDDDDEHNPRITKKLDAEGHAKSRVAAKRDETILFCCFVAKTATESLPFSVGYVH